jgi:aryl-alcohol dehydrogenase-like predicted oxidoreductase
LASNLPRRRCGRSGLELPALGLGCWVFGGGEYWGAHSQEDANAIVRCAVEHVCNYFDTAEMDNNGASESSLGRALQGIPRNARVAEDAPPDFSLTSLQAGRYC